MQKKIYRINEYSQPNLTVFSDNTKGTNEFDNIMPLDEVEAVRQILDMCKPTKAHNGYRQGHEFIDTQVEFTNNILEALVNIEHEVFSITKEDGYLSKPNEFTLKFNVYHFGINNIELRFLDGRPLKSHKKRVEVTFNIAGKSVIHENIANYVHAVLDVHGFEDVYIKWKNSMY